MSIKNDIADVFRRSLAVADSRASYLGAEIQRQLVERKRIEAKLEEASREPGRNVSAVCYDSESSVIFIFC